MAESSLKTFTYAEVATRNGRGSAPLWIIYKDSVYDVTNYINEHPGGLEPILDEAGTDVTKAFDSGHSKDARTIMEKYKIGEIIEEEKKYDANGKKKKRVVKVDPEGGSSGRSCLNVITCGLVG